MKRLVALLALAVAACAEAVTLSWSATDITSATYRQVSATQDFAIVITYATPDPPKGDWRTLLSIGAYKDGAYIGGDRQDLFRIQEANDGGSRRYFVYGNLNSDTNASASLAVSNDPQRFIVNKKGDTFTVYIGGKQVLSFAADSAYAADSYRLYVDAVGNGGGNTNGNVPTIAEAGIYDGALTDAQIAALSDTDTALQSIPEPTALALLALGVAGLALRRKTNDR